MSGYKDKKIGTLSKVWDSIRKSEIVAKLTFEQEEEMIDRIAGVINRFGMQSPALLLFEIVRPISYVVSNVAILPIAPFLELFGIRGFRYVSLLEKPANIERLSKKIEEEYIRK